MAESLLPGTTPTDTIIVTIFQRLKTSLVKEGVRNSAAKLYRWFLEYWFDFRYGLDTRTLSVLEHLTVLGQRESGLHYMPAGVAVLRRLFDDLKPMLPAEGVIVDYGCGKGRVLLIASEAGFRDARGVEFAHELCEIACKNCAVYKKKTGTPTDFRVVEGDAAAHPVAQNENVFFMFNPFKENIVNKVLDNITSSVIKHPRKVLVVYLHPVCGQIPDPRSEVDAARSSPAQVAMLCAQNLDQRSDFIRTAVFDYWGLRCAVYSNRSDPKSAL